MCLHSYCLGKYIEISTKAHRKRKGLKRYLLIIRWLKNFLSSFYFKVIFRNLFLRYQLNPDLIQSTGVCRMDSELPIQKLKETLQAQIHPSFSYTVVQVDIFIRQL